MKEKLLVSACLLGANCKYNGGNNECPAVVALGERFDLIPVCPETLGGLQSPREPAERVGDRVLLRTGEDVTAAFRLGAEKALALARANGVRRAVLKERSPSCGSGTIYDGTFSGAVIPADGVTAALLKRHGVQVLGESQVGELTEE